MPVSDTPIVDQPLTPELGPRPKSSPSPLPLPSWPAKPLPDITSPKTSSPKTEKPGSSWPSSVNKKPTEEKKSPTSPVEPTPKKEPVVGPSLQIPERVGFLTLLTRPFAQAFGVYDRGSLQKSDALKNAGEAYLKLFRQRDRAYGTLDLVSLVTDSSKALRKDFPAAERLQIGDVSSKHGGPVGQHSSHQNGLDADIVFLRKDRREMNPESARPNETGFDEDFVDAKGRVSSNFDVEANWRLVEILVSTGRIDRIFVDQNIKREFCEYAVSRGLRAEWTETLRKLRHWEKHQDHFHIRLTCPAYSSDCKATPPIPAGDGCDSLLDRSGGAAGFVSPGIFLTPNVDRSERGC
jgi:penicillin-insensitive murein endopeptidase